MKTILHKANNRGSFDFGWLKANYSFSFSNWYDPEKINFGALRVLNDDIIMPDNGFGMHPHENMEIVTLLLSGNLAHKDSLGNQSVIKEGRIQAMSAGTGIVHSEFNPSKTKPTESLQIWIKPKKLNIKPRYEEKEIDFVGVKNSWITLVSGKKEKQEAIWINQDSNFKIINLEKDREVFYKLEYEKDTGVYFFLISGSLKIVDQELLKRDALGIWDLEPEKKLKIQAKENSKLLAIEVAMF